MLLDSSDKGTIKISVSDPPPVGGKRSVNFGPGAEMLMNPNKQKQTSPRSDINLNDLTNSLDNINLDEVTPKRKRPSFTDIGSNLFKKPTHCYRSNTTSINESRAFHEPNQSCTVK